MRALLTVVMLAYCGLAPIDDKPSVKVTEPPHARLCFRPDPRQCPDSWQMTLRMTTASEAVYELVVNLDGKKGNVYQDWAQEAMMDANWMVEQDRITRTNYIYGVRTRDGRADAIKSLVLTNKLVDREGVMPHLEAFGGVKVETQQADGRKKADPFRRPLQAGPNLGPETFVEFDFSTLPPPMKDVYWNFTMKVHVDALKAAYTEEFRAISDFTKDAGMCRFLTCRFKQSGYKAELVDKLKVRVYGVTRRDRFYRVTHGIITSPDLKPEQLPKVTNPNRT